MRATVGEIEFDIEEASMGEKNGTCPICEKRIENRFCKREMNEEELKALFEALVNHPGIRVKAALVLKPR